MKRFSVHWEGNRDTSEYRGMGCVLPDHDRYYGDASKISTCKRYIREIKKNYADECPHNFRIYDKTLDYPYRHPVYVEE